MQLFVFLVLIFLDSAASMPLGKNLMVDKADETRCTSYKQHNGNCVNWNWCDCQCWDALRRQVIDDHCCDDVQHNQCNQNNVAINFLFPRFANVDEEGVKYIWRKDHKEIHSTYGTIRIPFYIYPRFRIRNKVLGSSKVEHNCYEPSSGNDNTSPES